MLWSRSQVSPSPGPRRLAFCFVLFPAPQSTEKSCKIHRLYSCSSTYQWCLEQRDLKNTRAWKNHHSLLYLKESSKDLTANHDALSASSLGLEAQWSSFLGPCYSKYCPVALASPVSLLEMAWPLTYKLETTF